MIMPKTPESHPWISLGSEQEIEEESLTESRPRVRQMHHGIFIKAFPDLIYGALAHLSVSLSSSGIRSLLCCGAVVLRCVSPTAALWTGRRDSWSARHTRTRASASERWRDTRPFRPPVTPNTHPLRHCGTNTSRHSHVSNRSEVCSESLVSRRSIYIYPMMHALQEVPKEHVDPVRVPRVQPGGERTSPAVRKPEELHHICTDKVERGHL